MITLVGTLHFDLKGVKRAGNILRHYGPHFIAIEDDEENFRQDTRFLRSISEPKKFWVFYDKLVQNVQGADPVTTWMLLSSLLYENRAIEDYISGTGAELVFADMPDEELAETVSIDDIVERKTRLMKKIIRKDRTEALRYIEAEYEREPPGKEYPQDFIELNKRRDSHTGNILRQLDADTVYFCGIEHAFGSYHPNLYDILQDQVPERIKLNQADSLA